MSDREVVLARLRAAVAGGPPAAPVPRAYRRAGAHPPGDPALLELLAERLADYRAGVHRATADSLPGTLARVLADRGARRVVVPPGPPADWVTAPLVDDGSLSWADLDACDGVITGCAVAVAETGTLVLSAPAQGRRAITLIPDLHVCVVFAAQVVHLLPEALERLDPTAPLTFVSGPSATSDIELDRVEGVHGPRTLEVVLVRS